MPLAPNSRLGPYEIKSVLGVGGMGEVYRARDSRLNRDVAIKVLRSDSTATPELKSRFEREARAVAALNHPNIVSVFDFGIDKVDGAEAQYIVSELIEGESLRQVISGKPIATRRLVDIAVQIADGLAAAHAAGIVHRDLKPENILVTKDGRAKILDFGLARQSTKTVPANSSDETFLPSSNQNLTSAGSILGTASYMSPEQAVGKEMDYRSDQFSFGLILHEMATGKQTFARNSSVETMAAIVRDEPPPIEEKLPAPLKWVIDRCLNKEPEQRYESTRDLYQELRNLREHFAESYTSNNFAPVATQVTRRKRWLLPTACAFSLLLGAGLIFLLIPVGQDIGSYRYTPFAKQSWGPVWSRDGKAVAYTGQVNGHAQAFLRYLNSRASVQLTHGTRSVIPQGWASDQTHLIVLVTTGRESPAYEIASLPIVGGEPEFLKNYGSEVNAWSSDGKVYAEVTNSRNGTPSSIGMSDPLGTPTRIYAPSPFAANGFSTIYFLDFSPDGKSILVFGFGSQNRWEAWLLPYPSGGRPARRVLQQLGGWFPQSFSWMPDNRHIVVAMSSDAKSPTHLWMADVDSDDSAPITTGFATEADPAVSPDGKTLFYGINTGFTDIVTVSVNDGSAATLMSTGEQELLPNWAARQEKLAWITSRNGPPEIWVRLPDGSERPVATSQDFGGTQIGFSDPSLSTDGDRIIYSSNDLQGRGRLWIYSLSGGSPIRLTDSEAGEEYHGAWSPDGSRFVYLLGSNGKTSLMSAKTNGDVTPVLLKDRVAIGYPDWSPRGDWISYRDEKGWNLISPDGKISKFLGNVNTDCLAFSKDGNLLYGVQKGPTAGSEQATLFALDVTTLKQKVIKELGKDLKPAYNRISLSPDGKSLAYSVYRSRYDLWMLTGYRQPGLWNQITNAFSPKAGN